MGYTAWVRDPPGIQSRVQRMTYFLYTPAGDANARGCQTVVDSKRLLENANWARYNLAVSKRKETEPTSSSMWNQNLPGAPVVNFHKFFDGENITQKDLVAWINVGTHHLVSHKLSSRHGVPCL